MMISQEQFDRDSRETLESLDRYANVLHTASCEADVIRQIVDETLRAIKSESLREALHKIGIYGRAHFDEEFRRVEALKTYVASLQLRDVVFDYFPITQEDRFAVLNRQQGLCFVCSEVLDGYWELDHHMPKCLGGEDRLDNRRALCVECNRRKGRQEPDEFYGVEE